jgi:hypothetical protein
MGEATDEDEQAKGKKNLQIRTELTAHQPRQQEQKLKQNYVGKKIRHVCRRVGPDKPGLRKIAKTMRQLALREQHRTKSKNGNYAYSEQQRAEGNANSEAGLHSQPLTFLKKSRTIHLMLYLK